MRLIDAQKFKEKVAAEVFKGVVPIEKGNAFMKLIDHQPTILSGEVKKAEFAYQRIVKIKPNKHDYGDGCYKYSCPVCEAVDNLHQVIEGDNNCSLCGVNLKWNIS